MKKICGIEQNKQYLYKAITQKIALKPQTQNISLT